MRSVEIYLIQTGDQAPSEEPTSNKHHKPPLHNRWPFNPHLPGSLPDETQELSVGFPWEGTAFHMNHVPGENTNTKYL